MFGDTGLRQPFFLSLNAKQQQIMKTNVNIQPFLAYVQKEWDINEITTSLENLYFKYTRAVMELSEKNNTSIAKDEIDALFLIQSLIKLFKATEIKE